MPQPEVGPNRNEESIDYLLLLHLATHIHENVILVPAVFQSVVQLRAVARGMCIGGAVREITFKVCDVGISWPVQCGL